MFVRDLRVIQAAMAMLFLALTMQGSHVEASRHSTNELQHFQISYQEQDSLFVYGRHSVADILVTSDYYRHYRLMRANAIASVMPPGLRITTSSEGRGRRNTVRLAGKALFVGKWCFNLALHMKVMARHGKSKHPTFVKKICLFAQDNMEYRYTKINATLPTAMKGSEYREMINLERNRRNGGVRSQVFWHDVPASVRLTNGRRAISLNGTPEDRYGYRLPKGYEAYGKPVKLGEFVAQDDRIASKFTHRDSFKYGYRITAVYPDGETRSNFVRLVHVRRGKIVMGKLHYSKMNGNEPLYFNVFRNDKDVNNYQLVARIPSQGSGLMHVIDTNLQPTYLSLQAEGSYYINVKHEPLRRSRLSVSYQQFELNIVE